MDRWERRLQVIARNGAPSSGDDLHEHGVMVGPDGNVIDAREHDGRPPTESTQQIHPEEAPVVSALLRLATERPALEARLPLLARAADGGWEHHWFAVVHELMGPVLRRVGEDDLQDSGHPKLGANLDDRPPGVDRTGLVAHLAAAIERCTQGEVALLLADIDRFKLHNDLYGSAVGDEILALTAERVDTVAGRSFSAAIGGDEFAIVLEHVEDPSRAKALAERLRRAIAEPLEVDGRTLTASATIGLAFARAGCDADHLLRDADTALFAGKDRGRDRVQVFGPQLQARVARQLGVTQHLRDALADGTLEMHYQPVVDLGTGEVVAAEALMRVGGDDGEPLSPASLIDAAEDSGLVATLGRYVLEETATQVARWERRIGRDHPFRVMVNVSPVQLVDRDFSNAIGHALGAARVDPRRFSLELNESVLVGSGPSADIVVADLVRLGIAFGLDGFGSAGSSLAGLRRFPLAFVKIDRELVDSLGEDPRVEAIVSASIDLAQRLDVSTVAVGVETEAQRDQLAALGCDAAQGYFFSPPLPPDELTRLL